MSDAALRRVVEAEAIWPYDAHMARLYWTLVQEKARREGSDGCSKVRDWYVYSCWEHDLHYLTGRRQQLVRQEGRVRLVDGEVITRRWADRRFRSVIRQLSWLAWASPMALWRFWGVRIAGQVAWRRYRRVEPYYARHPELEAPRGSWADVGRG